MGLRYGVNLMDSSSHSKSNDREQPIPFVVPDPDTVFRDALHFTSWTDSGGSLPQRGDWSTYRLASKDLILGIVTHRFNATTRQLDVRAYFCGEHPIFEEFEPTRALIAMLLCQSYQTGNSLEINFEQGIPFDVRSLIERHLGRVVSGHETLLSEDITAPLFVSICGLSDRLQSQIQEQGLRIATVCYNVLRGAWSSLQVNTLLERGIPLSWLFRKAPNPIENPAPYLHLIQNLRAVLLEEYALKRLEDRQFGESTSKRIIALDGESFIRYLSERLLEASADDISVNIPAGHPFTLVPVLLQTPESSIHALNVSLSRLTTADVDSRILALLPMDFVYAPADLRSQAKERMRAAGVDWLVVGQTMAQLFSEAEQKLAITAAQVDDDEVDARNVDLHTD
jgi:hypothetical protein